MVRSVKPKPKMFGSTLKSEFFHEVVKIRPERPKMSGSSSTPEEAQSPKNFLSSWCPDFRPIEVGHEN